MRAILCGLMFLCFMQSGCTDPRRPDLTTLLSPAGSDSCAEQVSVGSGIVHALSVIHETGQSSSACDVAEVTLQPISTSAKSEPAEEIRGTLRCRLIGYPTGQDSDQVFKVYVFSDGSAESAARTVCARLQATADPSFDFQYT